MFGGNVPLLLVRSLLLSTGAAIDLGSGIGIY